jgi:hypothetical protein
MSSPSVSLSRYKAPTHAFHFQYDLDGHAMLYRLGFPQASQTCFARDGQLRGKLAMPGQPGL